MSLQQEARGTFYLPPLALSQTMRDSTKRAVDLHKLSLTFALRCGRMTLLGNGSAVHVARRVSVEHRHAAAGHDPTREHSS